MDDRTDLIIMVVMHFLGGAGIYLLLAARVGVV